MLASYDPGGSRLLSGHLEDPLNELNELAMEFPIPYPLAMSSRFLSVDSDLYVKKNYKSRRSLTYLSLLAQIKPHV